MGPRADGGPLRHPLPGRHAPGAPGHRPRPAAEDGGAGAQVDRRLGVQATVAVTTDQKAALDGADFVIVCISTGGFRSMAVDLDVPAAHGITQTVGDSVGPGGINRALRNIPVLVGIGRTMEEVCPDAWLFNITNPMTTLTRAVCRETAHQDGRALPRSGELHHGSGHRPAQALGGGAAVGDRGEPLPGADRARYRRGGRLRHHPGSGRGGRGAGLADPALRAGKRPRSSPSSTLPSAMR